MNKEGISIIIFSIIWVIGASLLYMTNAEGILYGLYWVLCAAISFLYLFALGRQHE